MRTEQDFINDCSNSQQDIIHKILASILSQHPQGSLQTLLNEKMTENPEEAFSQSFTYFFLRCVSNGLQNPLIKPLINSLHLRLNINEMTPPLIFLDEEIEGIGIAMVYDDANLYEVLDVAPKDFEREQLLYTMMHLYAEQRPQEDNGITASGEITNREQIVVAAIKKIGFDRLLTMGFDLLDIINLIAIYHLDKPSQNFLCQLATDLVADDSLTTTINQEEQNRLQYQLLKTLINSKDSIDDDQVDFSNTIEQTVVLHDNFNANAYQYHPTDASIYPWLQNFYCTHAIQLINKKELLTALSTINKINHIEFEQIMLFFVIDLTSEIHQPHQFLLELQAMKPTTSRPPLKHSTVRQVQDKYKPTEWKIAIKIAQLILSNITFNDEPITSLESMRDTIEYRFHTWCNQISNMKSIWTWTDGIIKQINTHYSIHPYVYQSLEDSQRLNSLNFALTAETTGKPFLQRGDENSRPLLHSQIHQNAQNIYCSSQFGLPQNHRGDLSKYRNPASFFTFIKKFIDQFAKNTYQVLQVLSQSHCIERRYYYHKGFIDSIINSLFHAESKSIDALFFIQFITNMEENDINYSSLYRFIEILNSKSGHRLLTDSKENVSLSTVNYLLRDFSSILRGLAKPVLESNGFQKLPTLNAAIKTLAEIIVIKDIILNIYGITSPAESEKNFYSYYKDRNSTSEFDLIAKSLINHITPGLLNPAESHPQAWLITSPVSHQIQKFLEKSRRKFRNAFIIEAHRQLPLSAIQFYMHKLILHTFNEYTDKRHLELLAVIPDHLKDQLIDELILPIIKTQQPLLINQQQIKAIKLCFSVKTTQHLANELSTIYCSLHQSSENPSEQIRLHKLIRLLDNKIDLPPPPRKKTTYTKTTDFLSLADHCVHPRNVIFGFANPTDCLSYATTSHNRRLNLRDSLYEKNTSVFNLRSTVNTKITQAPPYRVLQVLYTCHLPPSLLVNLPIEFTINPKNYLCRIQSAILLALLKEHPNKYNNEFFISSYLGTIKLFLNTMNFFHLGQETKDRFISELYELNIITHNSCSRPAREFINCSLPFYNLKKLSLSSVNIEHKGPLKDEFTRINSILPDLLTQLTQLTHLTLQISRRGPQQNKIYCDPLKILFLYHCLQRLKLGIIATTSPETGIKIPMVEAKAYQFLSLQTSSINLEKIIPEASALLMNSSLFRLQHLSIFTEKTLEYPVDDQLEPQDTSPYTTQKILQLIDPSNPSPLSNAQHLLSFINSPQACCHLSSFTVNRFKAIKETETGLYRLSLNNN